MSCDSFGKYGSTVDWDRVVEQERERASRKEGSNKLTPWQ